MWSLSFQSKYLKFLISNAAMSIQITTRIFNLFSHINYIKISQIKEKGENKFIDERRKGSLELKVIPVKQFSIKSSKPDQQMTQTQPNQPTQTTKLRVNIIQSNIVTQQKELDELRAFYNQNQQQRKLVEEDRPIREYHKLIKQLKSRPEKRKGLKTGRGE
ncbi:hypothetical protein pb186bvf_015710 [Paramecium bursaria]